MKNLWVKITSDIVHFDHNFGFKDDFFPIDNENNGDFVDFEPNKIGENHFFYLWHFLMWMLRTIYTIFCI